MYVKDIRNIKLMVKFSKFTLEKYINEKFEEFLSKLVRRETLQTPHISLY